MMLFLSKAGTALGHTIAFMAVNAITVSKTLCVTLAWITAASISYVLWVAATRATHPRDEAGHLFFEVQQPIGKILIEYYCNDWWLAVPAVIY